VDADGSAGSTDQQADQQADQRADPRPDLERMMSQRFMEYLQLWEGVAAKFTRSAYRSEDLIDDWFTFCGNAVRDLTAGTALLWGVGGAWVPQPGPRPEEPPTTGSAEP
jgi:hypothetical protein